jgi:hypothetical protein
MYFSLGLESLEVFSLLSTPHVTQLVLQVLDLLLHVGHLVDQFVFLEWWKGNGTFGRSIESGLCLSFSLFEVEAMADFFLLNVNFFSLISSASCSRRSFFYSDLVFLKRASWSASTKPCGLGSDSWLLDE